MHLILATPSAAIRTFTGGVLRSFATPRAFGSIGSGAEFVYRALQRDTQNGLMTAAESVTDTLVLAENYADAANESLTVDNKFTIGLLVGDRTYLMGDAEIRPAYGPQALLDHWPQASLHFDEIIALVRTIRGEIRSATAEFYKIAQGAIPVPDACTAAALSIGAMRTRLDASLAAYISWYDQLLGR